MALSNRAHPLESVDAYSKKSEESNDIIAQSSSTTTSGDEGAMSEL